MDRSLFLEALRNLCLKTNESFEKNPSNYKFAGERKHKYVIEDEHKMSSREVIVPDFRLNLFIIKENLAKIEEFKRMKEIINLNENISRCVNCMIQVSNSRFRYEDNDLILSSIRFVLEHLHENIPLDEVVSVTYDKIEQFYSSHNISHKGVIYIENARFLISPISLEENISIRSLTREDRVDLLNKDKYFESLYGFTSSKPWADVDSVLEFTFQRELLTTPYNKTDEYRFKRQPDPEILNNINMALNAVRLVEEVFINTSHMYIHWNHSPFDSNIEPISLFIGNPPQRITHNISSEQCDEMTKTYRILAKLELLETENIALHRLSRINSRETFEDQFIDLFIGFEAIVLGEISRLKGVHGEMRFRLSIVTSKYLEQDSVQQIRIFKIMKDGYDLRSAIVHGKSIKDNERDIKLFVELINIYKSLLKKWFTDRDMARKINTEEILFN